MTPEKRVAEIELYHTLTLIFSQPQEFVNKYFSHNPHWWSCVGWRKRSHRIHWQDWILQFFTMVCLIFHTVIIINRKKWRITINFILKISVFFTEIFFLLSILNFLKCTLISFFMKTLFIIIARCKYNAAVD